MIASRTRVGLIPIGDRCGSVYEHNQQDRSKGCGKGAKTRPRWCGGGAKQKRVTFLPGEVSFLLIGPLMGDPSSHSPFLTLSTISCGIGFICLLLKKS
jgi:hypothetical protein